MLEPGRTSAVVRVSENGLLPTTNRKIPNRFSRSCGSGDSRLSAGEGLRLGDHGELDALDGTRGFHLRRPLAFLGLPAAARG